MKNLCAPSFQFTLLWCGKGFESVEAVFAGGRTSTAGSGTVGLAVVVEVDVAGDVGGDAVVVDVDNEDESDGGVVVDVDEVDGIDTVIDDDGADAGVIGIGVKMVGGAVVVVVESISSKHISDRPHSNV